MKLKHRLNIAFRKWLFTLSYKQQLLGFDVRMLLPEEEDKVLVFPRIAESLGLISHVSPHRFAQLRRQMNRIWVFGIPPYLASWDGDMVACVLDRAYVRNGNLSPEALAATFMHEATHARIESFGIPYREDIRGRIERLCFISELWLAKRLPNGEAIEKSVQEYLKTPDTYWIEEAFKRRNREALLELGRDNCILSLIANWVNRKDT